MYSKTGNIQPSWAVTAIAAATVAIAAATAAVAAAAAADAAAPAAFKELQQEGQANATWGCSYSPLSYKKQI